MILKIKCIKYLKLNVIEEVLTALLIFPYLISGNEKTDKLLIKSTESETEVAKLTDTTW